LAERQHSSGATYASWWQRAGAEILDGLIVGIPIGILIALMGFSGGRYSFFYAVAAFGYNSLLDGGEDGQTIGKRIVGIRVVDDDTAGPIGVQLGAARSAIPAVVGLLGSSWIGAASFGFSASLVGLIDVLWPLWDPRRQALHDKLARSVVVQV
jgi:uncharacterized RDD family membrane protein YckC